MKEVLTSENAPYILKCSHQIGKNIYKYCMRCHILNTTKSQKLKILVFGDRFWKDKEHISRVRYVSPDRVIKNIEGFK